MADSPRVSFRCQADLRAAMQAAANKVGLDLGEWLRRTAAQALGRTAEPMPMGFAALSTREKRRIARLGGKKAKEKRDAMREFRRTYGDFGKNDE